MRSFIIWSPSFSFLPLLGKGIRSLNGGCHSLPLVRDHYNRKRTPWKMATFLMQAPVNRADHFHHSTHLSPSHRQPCRAAGPQRRGITEFTRYWRTGNGQCPAAVGILMTTPFNVSYLISPDVHRKQCQLLMKWKKYTQSLDENVVLTSHSTVEMINIEATWFRQVI